MTEHLFRDEQGAALERSVRLEEENAQLRAQLAHERSARQAQTVRTKKGSAGAVIAFVAFAVVIGLAAMGAAAALLLFRRAEAPRIALPAPPAEPSPLAFDRAAAAAALGSIDIQDCKTEGGPTGTGHVKVTFAPTGRVLSAEVDSQPFIGTPAGNCIGLRYQLVQIPPFAGSSVAVGKSFTLD